MKRTGSVETEGGQDSPRGRTPGDSSSRTSNGGSSRRFKKSVSIGETISEGDALWKSTDSTRGSNESLASNASIPLPIPVRTRSTAGGLESGYSSSDTYNALTIRRLERGPSEDRLSTGSRESTQSDWMPGEKKKSKGLMGKLKKITRSVSKDRTNEEQEFGSGSDISSASHTSKVSTSSKMSTASKILQRARSASKDRSGEQKEKTKSGTPFGPPGNANAAFDKYFDKSGAGNSTSKPSTPSVSSTSGSTLPKPPYRRY